MIRICEDVYSLYIKPLDQNGNAVPSNQSVHNIPTEWDITDKNYYDDSIFAPYVYVQGFANNDGSMACNSGLFLLPIVSQDEEIVGVEVNGETWSSYEKYYYYRQTDNYGVSTKGWSPDLSSFDTDYPSGIITNLNRQITRIADNYQPMRCLANFMSYIHQTSEFNSKLDDLLNKYMSKPGYEHIFRPYTDWQGVTHYMNLYMLTIDSEQIMNRYPKPWTVKFLIDDKKLINPITTIRN